MADSKTEYDKIDGADTVTFTTTVRIADVDGSPINRGDVLREVDGGAVGVVIGILKEGDAATHPMSALGDLTIELGNRIRRITNKYTAWKKVPHNDQTVAQRVRAWQHKPYDFDPGEELTRDEGLAITGIMSLLRNDVVDWEHGPWPDSLGDALNFLAERLGKLEELESSDEFNVVLRDHAGGEATLPVKVRHDDGFIEISPKGYGYCTSEDGKGSPILLEFYEGELCIRLYGDINTEDPTHSLRIEGARESQRKPEEPEEGITV
jgi:hypothetical protein